MRARIGSALMDGFGSDEVTANGTRSATSTESSLNGGGTTFSMSAVEERLDALLQRIRTWDWRTTDVGTASAPVEVAPVPLSDSVIADPEAGGAFFFATGAPSPAETAESPSESLEAPARHARIETIPDGPTDDPGAATPQGGLAPQEFVTAQQPVVAPVGDEDVNEAVDVPSSAASSASVSDASAFATTAATEAAITADPVSPSTADPDISRATVAQPGPTVLPGSAMPDGTRAGAPGPATPTTRRGLRGWWSRPGLRLAVLCGAGVVAVVLIVGGIRLTAKNGGSGSGLTATTTTQSHHSSTTGDSHAVLPITNAELTQFEGYAQGMEQANATASHGIARSSATPAEASPVTSAYEPKVNLYDFQLGVILKWPVSMQSDIASDIAELKALKTFLPSLGTVGPTGMRPWLAQLRSRRLAAQSADNQVRKDLGLPALAWLTS